MWGSHGLVNILLNSIFRKHFPYLILILNTQDAMLMCPLVWKYICFFFFQKNTVAMVILEDIIWSSSRVLSIEWLLTFLPPLWSETLYPKRKTNLDNLSSRKSKIFWGYCYPIGRHHGQKLFLFEKQWPSQNGHYTWKRHKMFAFNGFGKLALHGCSEDHRCYPNSFAAPHTHSYPPLSQPCSSKHTHRLGHSCVLKALHCSFFCSLF